MYRFFILIGIIWWNYLSASSSEIININDNFKDTLLCNSKNITMNANNGDKVFDLLVHNTSNKNRTLYLIFNNPLIDSIIILSNNDTLKLLGDMVEFSNNELHEPNNITSISIKQHQQIKLSIIEKLQADGLTTNVYLSSQNTFLQKTNHDNLLLGTFFGTFFMFLILITAIYIYSKNRYFILYELLSLISLLICIYFSGIGHQYIWKNSLFLKQYLPLILIGSYLAVHTFFIYSFFNIKHRTAIIRIGFYMLFFGFCTQIIYTLVKLIFPNYQYLPIAFDYYYIYILFILYSIYLILITIYAYIKSKKRETFWILIGAVFQFFSWLLFYNNLIELSKSLTIINQIKLFSSYLYLSHINILFLFIELLTISTFICISYINLLKEHNKTIINRNILYQNNLTTYYEGENYARTKVNNLLQLNILNQLQFLKEDIDTLYNNEGETKGKTDINELLEKIEYDIDAISAWQVHTEIETIYTLLFKIQKEYNNLISFKYTVVSEIKNNLLDETKLNHLKYILTECINNTLKHAKNATQVNCIIEKKRNKIQISIDDDGSSKVIINTSGMGLLSIQQRVKSMNGKISFNRKNGFNIQIIIPIKK
ncbi:MAG: hypothetical protein H6553_08415 [Chitinophagales bacterium]|nr:hypothetical protein [Chitinophagales bacterium]